MHTLLLQYACIRAQEAASACWDKLYNVTQNCTLFWLYALLIEVWYLRYERLVMQSMHVACIMSSDQWPVWRASVWRPVWAVWAVWSEIQFWSDKTRPLVAEAGHSRPPRNPICRTNNSQQMGRQKMTWAISNVRQSSFQIWDGHMLFSVFCTSNLIGIYCHISHLTWVHVIFCIWSSRRPQPAVTGVISNKKLQILTKGEKATHSQLPPRESWVNMTWWMQWMSDLNREIFQFSKNLNLEKLSGYNNMNAINAWIEPCNIWVFLALW